MQSMDYIKVKRDNYENEKDNDKEKVNGKANG